MPFYNTLDDFLTLVSIILEGLQGTSDKTLVNHKLPFIKWKEKKMCSKVIAHHMKNQAPVKCSSRMWLRADFQNPFKKVV